MNTQSSFPRTEHHHHVIGIVIALGGTFAALCVSVYLYNVNTGLKQSPLPNTNNRISANPQPDTPIGRTSFAGTIRDAESGRITVRTTIVRNGEVRDLLMLVTVTPSTHIVLVGKPAPAVLQRPGSAIRSETITDASSLQVGRNIEVDSATVIDGRTSVDAVNISVLSP